MERHELETAIALGIVKGVLGILALCFVFWLFSSTLIPFALDTQIYFAEHGLKILLQISVGLCGGLVLWILWLCLVDSRLGQWFKARLTDEIGFTIGWRAALLNLGCSTQLFFLVWCWTSLTMTRDFTTDDLLLIIGTFCISVTSLYFALWWRYQKELKN